MFTIGHSNHPLEKFISLLKEYEIKLLIDTRSHPYSRHVPNFDAHSLKAALSKRGISYLFLGRQLGGRPEGEEFYDAKGRVDYALVARSRRFLNGISMVEREIRTNTVVLLCSEEDPARCHRRLLVGQALEKTGITLRHIRGDGSVQTDGETDGQPVLFPETEVSTRKSIRSVSRRRRRPSSSEH